MNKQKAEHKKILNIIERRNKLKMAFGKVEFCYPLNNVIKPVVFEEGETIQDLLNKGNITLSKEEMIKDNAGSIVDVDDEAVEGEYFITSNAKNGSI